MDGRSETEQQDVPPSVVAPSSSVSLPPAPAPKPVVQPEGQNTQVLSAEQMQLLRKRALEGSSSPAVEEELSAALSIAEDLRSRALPINDKFERLQFIFDCLATETPKLELANHERVRLQMEVYRHSGRFAALLVRIGGGGSPSTVITALMLSLMIWTVVMSVVHLLVEHPAFDLAGETFFMNGRAIVAVTSAAFVGGILSIATRLREFTDIHDINPFSMFWTALLKPLIGVAVALFIMAALAGEIISFGFLGDDPLRLAQSAAGGVEADIPLRTLYILWVMGFLSGFSERFAWDFVDRAQGVIGSGKVVVTPTA